MNHCIATVTLNLMLHNMCGFAYWLVQPVLGFLLLPLFAVHVCGVSAETEI